jgi:serine/threonine-protein kinase
MATVYLGRAVGPGGFERFVAIKVMHPHLAADPEFVKSFLDEARLAARIQHPNVVATLDVDATDGGAFLVMDYVDGQTLHAIQKRLRTTRARMPLRVVLRIMIDALSGLHAAHELTSDDGKPLQLVHRDVSPQNIILGYDGITRIVDFGVARAESRLGESTDTGQLKGKYGYMSIEQLRAESVDRRSDIYSAAVVMWELLAGERLFTGDNEGAVALAAAAGAVQSPRDINADVPEPLDDVVMRALHRTPDRRYPDAAAFAEAIEDAAHACDIRPARHRHVEEFLDEIADTALTEVRPKALMALSRRLRKPPHGDDPKDGANGDADGVVSVSPGSAPGAGPWPDAAPPAHAAMPPLVATDDLAQRQHVRPLRPTPVELHALTPSSPTTTAGALVPTTEPLSPRSRRAVAFAAFGAAGVLVAIMAMVLLRPAFVPDEQAAPESSSSLEVLSEPERHAPSSAGVSSPSATLTPQPPAGSESPQPTAASKATQSSSAPANKTTATATATAPKTSASAVQPPPSQRFDPKTL